MANYTKGEWKAEIGYEDSYIVCKSKEGITGIATVHKKNPMNPANGSTEANAYLIAASPLMFEALKAIINRRMENHETEATYIPPEIDLVYKALAKAEGI